MAGLGNTNQRPIPEDADSAAGSPIGAAEKERVLKRKRFWEIADGRIGIVRDLLRPYNLDALPLKPKRPTNNELAPDPELDRWIRLFLAHTRSSELYLTDYSAQNVSKHFRETPAYAYFEFIHKQRKELDRIVKQARSQSYKKNGGNVLPGYIEEQISRDAVTQIIPDWKGLNALPGSDWIINELNAWATKFNLSDDWCKDFALEFLANMKTEVVDKYRLNDDYVENGDCWDFKRRWNNGSLWERVGMNQDLDAIGKARDEVESLSKETQQKLVFKYEWPVSLGESGKGTFEIRNEYMPQFPGNDAVTFKKSVSDDFWYKLSSYIGANWTNCEGKGENIANKINQFEKKLVKFVKDADSELGLRNRRSDLISLECESDRDLLWLVDFQFKKMSYEKIANDADSDRHTVMRKVKTMASGIGLTLRKAYVGKPLGAKDNLPRGSRIKSANR